MDNKVTQNSCYLKTIYLPYGRVNLPCKFLLMYKTVINKSRTDLEEKCLTSIFQ